MSNDKKISITWFLDKLIEHQFIKVNVTTYGDKVKYKHEILLEQALEMYHNEIEQAELDAKEIVIIKQCAEESTSAASQKTEAFPIGYEQGYNRALELSKWAISNLVPPHNENTNNEFRKGTSNTTGTTFLCTEFVSDQLFYKGTLPHCIRCGKAQYQHPIISNTTI